MPRRPGAHSLVDAKAKGKKQPHSGPNNCYPQNKDTVLGTMGSIRDLNADHVANGEKEEFRSLDRMP